MCEAKLQELKKQPVKCADCRHEQVKSFSSRGDACGLPGGNWLCGDLSPAVPAAQENKDLQGKLAELKQEREKVRSRLSELELEVEQKTNRLAEVELRLKDLLAEKADEEERLGRRLRDCQETIASLRAQPPQIKVTGALGRDHRMPRRALSGRGGTGRDMPPAT